MTLLDKYHALPRATRWGIAAAAFLVLYFGVAEPVLGRWNKWSSEADRLQAFIDKWAQGKDGDESAIANNIRVFGRAQFPGPEAERSQSLRARIAEVLQAHGIRESAEKSSAEIPLPNGPLNTAMGARVKRLVRQVSFECSPETMAEIVADLERSPDIAAVSRVSVRKVTGTSGARSSSNARLVSVNLFVEAWAIAREGGAS